MLPKLYQSHFRDRLKLADYRVKEIRRTQQRHSSAGQVPEVTSGETLAARSFYIGLYCETGVSF